MNIPKRPFTTVASRIAWSCPWYRIRQDDIITPSGQSGVYNTIEKSDAVWIVPVTNDGLLAMVYQYRYTIDDWCWEIPAGSVKDGQTAKETALEELREEVGGTTAALEYIGKYYLANGICNETGHIFMATGVTIESPQHEPAEIMHVHLKTIPEVLSMARNHQITDGPSALALLLCAEKLEGLAARSHSG